MVNQLVVVLRMSYSTHISWSDNNVIAMSTNTVSMINDATHDVNTIPDSTVNSNSMSKTNTSTITNHCVQSGTRDCITDSVPHSILELYDELNTTPKANKDTNVHPIVRHISLTITVASSCCTEHHARPQLGV